MSEKTAIVPNAENVDKKDELSDEQLDDVTGGKATPKLLEACVKGTHLPEVTIEMV